MNLPEMQRFASAANTASVGRRARQRASERERERKKVLRGGEKRLRIVHTALCSPTKFGQASDGREKLFADKS